ncbi:MAG: PFL family protein [Planctomycetes bacterium]|nr:PFL family protein [Planctomycetota bacterium]MCB9908701.1 PFL family protein [Planctomycetota bacterium]HPF13932.1 PFL family protein [Planctomycetota bacterium]
MVFTDREILETVRMLELETLDIRTTTLGINLLDCADPDLESTAEKIYAKVVHQARNLVAVAQSIEADYGVPIVNKRIAVTPISLVAAACGSHDLVPLARALDAAAKAVGVDFIGGFSAYVHKGFTRADDALFASIPEALAQTDHVCSSVSLGTTRAGINMDATARFAEVIKETARLTADKGGLGCAKLVCFTNPVEDNPFVAGAHIGIGEPETVLSVGVSGPGVVRSALERLGPEADLLAVSEVIKRTAFKITRVGELFGREAARRLGTTFGIVDISLAPTPAIGDSVSDILERIGVERTGAPGTTAALALLTDAVKKGGAMASSSVGGLSGAFIPVSEDEGMIDAVRVGALSLAKLEAMTTVCSVGLDMVAVPGDTPVSTLMGILADEMAIGMVNNKTTAVRIIPVPGKGPGETVEWGGLLGTAIVQDPGRFHCDVLYRRGGRIPAPIQSYRN